MHIPRNNIMRYMLWKSHLWVAIATIQAKVIRIILDFVFVTHFTQKMPLSTQQAKIVFEAIYELFIELYVCAAIASCYVKCKGLFCDRRSACTYTWK